MEPDISNHSNYVLFKSITSHSILLANSFYSVLGKYIYLKIDIDMSNIYISVSLMSKIVILF